MSEASPVTTEQRSERKSSLLDFPNKAVPSRETQTGRSERVAKVLLLVASYNSLKNTSFKVLAKE